MTKTLRAKSVRGRIDFVVITIREDEFHAVVRRFTPRDLIFGGKQHYEYCQFQKADGSYATVAITRSIDQGHNFAALATSEAIADLAPSWIVLAGIAGAVPDKEFTLGDVLIANSVLDFSVWAAIEDERPQFRTRGSQIHPAVERLLSTLMAHNERLGQWGSETRLGRSRPFVIADNANDYVGPSATRTKLQSVIEHHFGKDVPGRMPKYTTGAVATSNALVKDTELLKHWQHAARHITHVEMELGGAIVFASRAGDAGIPLLSVRGISDVIGFKRSDEWLAYACESAGSLLHSMLTNLPHEAFGLRRRMGLAGRIASQLPVITRPVNRLIHSLKNFVASLVTMVAAKLSRQSLSTPSVEQVAAAFAKSSAPLISRAVTASDRIERPELGALEARFENLDGKAVCLLGSPGSGKTALLALLAKNAVARGVATFAIKADLLPHDRPFDAWGERTLSADVSAIEAVRIVAARQPVLVIVDQLDALSSLVVTASDVFNLTIEFILACVAVPGVTVVCSCRVADYNHDARFSELDADVLSLELPNWADVSTQLLRYGIVDSDKWPESFRTILQTPQHLRVYLDHFGGPDGSIYQSYHAMLDTFWQQVVRTNAEQVFMESITWRLMDEESLWLPLAAFPRDRGTIDALAGKGLLTVEGLRFGFRHQTLLEHAKAILFTMSDRSLCDYAIQNQESLQVRPTVWAVLQYLREAHSVKYRRELERLLSSSPRLHLRYLLIEFLGQVQDPADFEIVLMASCLSTTGDRGRALIAIRGSEKWFEALSIRHFPVIMQSEATGQWPMVGVINAAWTRFHDSCLDLVRRYWLPDPAKDMLTQSVLREMDIWGPSEVEVAISLVQRYAGVGERVWWTEGLVLAVSKSRPDLAPRLFLAVVGSPADETPPSDGRDASGDPRPLESSNSWYFLPDIAEAAPLEFLRTAWPWVVRECELHHSSVESSVLYRYSGYLFELEESMHVRQSRVLIAITKSIDIISMSHPQTFVEITRPSWLSTNAVVHRLIIRGLKEVVAAHPSDGMEYLAGDRRRLAVGRWGGSDEADSVLLIRAIAESLTQDAIPTLERMILAWSEYRDGIQLEPSQHKWDREARLRLLSAIPEDRLSREIASFKNEEMSQLPHWQHDPPRLHGGFVRTIPPVSKDEIAVLDAEKIAERIASSPIEGDARDSQVEVEDGWERGGDREDACRELALLNKSDARKVVDVIVRLVIRGIEDPVSAAFSGLDESDLSDAEVIKLATVLIDLNPSSVRLRRSIAYLIYRRMKSVEELPRAICDVLKEWLLEEAHRPRQTVEAVNTETKVPQHNGPVVWRGTGGGFRHSSTSNCFWLMLSSGEAFLQQKAPQYTEWISTLELCLDGDIPEGDWALYCTQLSDVRFAGPSRVRGVELVIKLIQKYALLNNRHRGAFVLLANIGDLFPQQEMAGILHGLRRSDDELLRQGYGELLTLFAVRSAPGSWSRSQLDSELAAISSSDFDEWITTGIAYTAANAWDDAEARSEASGILSRLIPFATAKSGTAIASVFQAVDEFSVSDATDRLLSAIAENPSSVNHIPVNDLVPHLSGLAPYRQELVLSLCSVILDHQSDTTLFEVGPQLVKIAMTLQRFSFTRDRSLALFERLLAAGLDDAFRVLVDIDIRPGSAVSVANRDERIRRRRYRR